MQEAETESRVKTDEPISTYNDAFCRMFAIASVTTLSLIWIIVHKVMSYYQYCDEMHQSIHSSQGNMMTISASASVIIFKLIESFASRWTMSKDSEFKRLEDYYGNMLVSSLFATIVTAGTVEYQLSTYWQDLALFSSLIYQLISAMKISTINCEFCLAMNRSCRWISSFIVVISSFAAADMAFQYGSGNNYDSSYYLVGIILMAICFVHTIWLLDLMSLKPVINPGKALLFIFLVLKLLMETGIYVSRPSKSSAFMRKYLFIVVLSALYSMFPKIMCNKRVEDLLGELQAKLDFVSAMVHELRTPMTAINVAVDNIHSEIADLQMMKKQSIVDILEHIDASSKTALSVVGNLLTLDKIRAEKLVLKQKFREIRSFVYYNVHLLHILAKVSKVDLICLCPELPGSIYIDVEKLGMVLKNLLSNAIKFSKESSKVEVTVSLHEDRRLDLNNDNTSEQVTSENPIPSAECIGVIRVEVRDYGAGISQADQEKLFNLFVQVKPDEIQGGKGSGIGLWLSKTLIEAHCGKIDVYTPSDGKGTCFYFELPYYNMEPIADPEVNKSFTPQVDQLHLLSPEYTVKRLPFREDYRLDPQSTVIPSSRLIDAQSPNDSPYTTSSDLNVSEVDSLSGVSRKRVLVVDDALSMRKMVMKKLETLNYKPTGAASGNEALDVFSQHPLTYFHAIITDAQMGQMSGFDLVKAIRDKEYCGIILGITGKCDEDVSGRLKDAGANEVFPKPFDGKAFERALEK